MPTRANCQKEICTRLLACCRTIKLATELRGVAFLPAYSCWQRPAR